jgi:hypothetical protein
MVTQTRNGGWLWLWVPEAGALADVDAGSEWDVEADVTIAEPAVGITGRVGVCVADAVGSGVLKINSREAVARSTSFHAADMVASG